ncbi:YhcN/YlaJ family sporulation lipoprotein [Paenibacillus crassostreae]|uniref:Sporulation protein n=1 Tax=Paenibacillus crassostreae TaxID=1763538 RepID=A0A167C396_9BACL|nr:YhcN/YlaJ family sporulation lipoprotein [Paenibacillus crassostreae]AOZ91699.1 sporulation protein [Paenibacillus crassostreae]OAB72729.1 sporulation protein [Paenibacillus crassostreae]
MRLCLCFIVLLSLLTSCGTASDNASPSPRNQQQNQEMDTLNIRSATDDMTDQSQDLSLKNHLEALAERVSGVERAHCVVIGDTAVVGIDVDGDLPRSRVGTIKYSVAEALRADPQGMRSLVTADMDLSHRLDEIGKHIRQGRPISGFSSELADIVGRIIPQLPKDVKSQQDPASPQSPATNQNIAP